MPYFLVADAAASVAQVAEFGGEVKMGPIEMNNVGRYAEALDPQGAAFAIFEPAQKGKAVHAARLLVEIVMETAVAAAQRRWLSCATFVRLV